MSFSCGKRQRVPASFRHQPSLLSLAKHRKTHPEPSKWSQLPLEILVYILNYLEHKDRRNFFLVCTHWSRTANIPSLWVNAWVFMKSFLTSKSLDFWHLVARRSLSKVVINGCGLQDHLDSDLVILHSNIPHLIGLHIDCVNSRFVSSNVFKQILKFKDLKELKFDFTKCHFTSVSMIFNLVLKELTKLESLSLLGMMINAPSDCDFLFHPTLSSLCIDSCGTIKPFDTSCLISLFPQLCKLTIKNCHYYCSFLSHRSPCADYNPPPLSEVCLTRTMFNGSVCNLPKWFCQISSLDLSFCKQKREQLSHLLSQLPRLKKLNLTGNFCTDETLNSLVSPLIDTLDLSFNQDITVQGLHNLSSFIGPSLVSLSLSHCSGLISKREDILYTVMTLFPNIKSLDLSGWNLSSQRMTRLLHSSTNTQTVIICDHVVKCNNCSRVFS